MTVDTGDEILAGVGDTSFNPKNAVLSLEQQPESLHLL
jgi:hypothetical protein